MEYWENWRAASFHAHMHIVPRYADELYAGKGMRYWIKQSENKRKNADERNRYD